MSAGSDNSRPRSFYGDTHDRERTFRWYVLRTGPRKERRVAEIIRAGQREKTNILEVFCPINTTVRVRRRGKDVKAPLYAGHVFVYATYNALHGFVKENSLPATILFSHIAQESHGNENSWQPVTIPDRDMKLFRRLNDTYSEQMVVLDRNYSDYAFNPKNGKENEVVKIMDGDFAGRKGYFVRFGGDRRLVFSILSEEGIPSLSISIPNVWSFRVARLVNGEKRTIADEEQRHHAVDRILGVIQGCGNAETSLDCLYDITDLLVEKPSWTELCKEIKTRGNILLANALASFSKEDVATIINLIRYETDNRGYVRDTWISPLRPFLTPIQETARQADCGETVVTFHSHTEIMRRVSMEDQVFYPSRQEERTVVTDYHAHICCISMENGKTLCFTNMDRLLAPYFLTGGKANRRLVQGRTVRQEDAQGQIKQEKTLDSFRNYAPTLHAVLTDPASPVKVRQITLVSPQPLHTLCAVADSPASLSATKQLLLDTSLAICREIHTTTHLAVWRRYLSLVWLHK